MKNFIIFIALFAIIVAADDFENYNSNVNQESDYYMKNNEEAAAEPAEYYSENNDQNLQSEVVANEYHSENNEQNLQPAVEEAEYHSGNGESGEPVEYNSEDNNQSLQGEAEYEPEPEPQPQPEPMEHHSGNNDKILKQDTLVTTKGFKYNFETSNGIYTDGSGMLKDFGKGYRDISKGLRRDNGHYHGKNYRHDEVHKAVVVDGAFGWVDKKTGAKFDIKYVADERGYQPAPIRLPKH